MSPDERNTSLSCLKWHISKHPSLSVFHFSFIYLLNYVSWISLLKYKFHQCRELILFIALYILSAWDDAWHIVAAQELIVKEM